jgi:nucleotide-binding universal stress UspA family protein
MFRKIVVAHNESPEAERALGAAVKLAKSLNGELHRVIVMSGLPAYAAFAHAADPSGNMNLTESRLQQP